MITITKTRKNTPWIYGTTSDGLTFEARVHPEPSPAGIKTPAFEEGNNITALFVKNAEGESVFEYDRGGSEWFANIDELDADQYAELVMFLETTFMA